MTATAHALVAGAIASKFPDPTVAATLALSSHFIMDTIPHWDVGTNWRNRPKYVTGILAIAETLTGIVVGLLVYNQHAPIQTLLIAIIFSILPDWLEAPWYIFFATPKHTAPSAHASLVEQVSFWIYKGENFFHTRAGFPLGVFTQIGTVAFFLILLKK